MIEFAIAVPLLLMVMFFIVDGSRAIYAHHFVAQAAQAGVRYAAIRGSSWPGACAAATSAGCTASAANVTAFVQSTATIGLTASSLVVITTWPGTNPGGASCDNGSGPSAPGCLVTVQISYPFRFTLPFIMLSRITMNSSATAVIQQ